MLEKHPSSASTLADAVWIDLREPTDEERAQVEQATKLWLPTRDSIQEIEHSSRAFVEGRALYLSTPVLAGTDCLNDALATVGFVLSPEQLVTVRFARVAAFVLEAGEEHRPAAAVPRLEAIRADIASLSDYQHHLSGKVQFLLDATLGFINIQQNDIVKALTIVSVVGVPPVLIAGIYGMNFKVMPELTWALGYPYSLALIVVSALLPIAWFKWRDWL